MVVKLDIPLYKLIPPLSIPLTGGVVTGIPQLDQLHEPTLDGAADENTRDNCVFTCNAMLSRLYRPDLNADGDAIKDSSPSYGQGYTGFASQDTLIRDGVLESKWGIHSWRINALNRNALLAQIITLANQGTPSVVTIPSQWGSQPSQPGYNPDNPSFYTHACVFAGTTADGTCVLINPWGGFLMYYSQADLALRLCYLCAYPVTKATGGGGTVGIPNGWTDDGTTLHAPDGTPVVRGFRAEVLARGWDADNWPMGAEYGANPCDPTDPNSGPGSIQWFRKSILVYRQRDNAIVYPWTGAVALNTKHDLDSARVALATQVPALQAQVADLTAKLAAAQQQQPAPSNPVAQKALAALQTLKSALAEL